MLIMSLIDRQIAPTASISILTMSTVAFLEGLFAPSHTQRSIDYIGTLTDWFPVQNSLPVFHGIGDFVHFEWSCTRFNMRACIPDERGHRVEQFKDGYGVSPATLGFPLKRQAARVTGFSGTGDHFAVEFLVSISLILRYRPSVFKHTIVVWLDYRIDLDGSPEHSSLFSAVPHRVDLEADLKDCGRGGAGILQFMKVLVRCIDYWRKRWDTMMAKVNEIVSVQLFNASTLREALKAKTLNLLIGVFTVVTVFYTPLSFMAVSSAL